MATKREVLQGTLDLLILSILQRQPNHGYGMMQQLERLTEGVFQVTAGSLFPALQRLEESGWIKGSWGASDNNRRARFYELTAAGRKQLQREEKNWSMIALAIRRVTEGT